MALYAAMMDEARIRIETIEYLCSGLLNFHPVIIRESAYLQLRMLCELIALGCLVAHGDVPATRSKSLSKAWHAEDIIKGIERLHFDFYPHPVNPIRHPTHVHLEPIRAGFLTKAELLSLIGRAGDVIHRGNLRKILAGPISAIAGYPDVLDWLAKVKMLLRVHRIALVGGSHFVCHISAQSEGGRAQIVHAEAALPPTELLRAIDPDNPAT